MKVRVLLLAALLFACGGGSDDGNGLEDAFREQTEQTGTGQWSRLYAALHPAQQALISEPDFVQCFNERYASPVLDSLTIDETFEEEFTIPGTSERITTTALTFTAEAGIQKQSDTVHLVEVDGRWRWFMGDPAEDCPEV